MLGGVTNLVFKLKPAQCFRQFSHSSTPPGLRFVPKLLSDKDEVKLLQDAHALNGIIQEQARTAIEKQATTYLSRQHNLPSKESYRLLAFKNEKGKNINAQHFSRYGEDGHQLTYFIGNNNIPSFVRKSLISSMEKFSEVQALMSKTTAESPLQWNFTFNVYLSDPNTSMVAGFPYHIDTPSNGEITAIFTLLNSAELQMKREEDVAEQYSEVLTPGSIVMLSGESRWSWLHRIVPKKIASFNQQAPDLIHRMSLVVGCQLPHVLDPP